MAEMPGFCHRTLGHVNPRGFCAPGDVIPVAGSSRIDRALAGSPGTQSTRMI
jgi:hypothetical protein